MTNRFTFRSFVGKTFASWLIACARLTKIAALSPAAGLAQESAALPGFDDASREALRVQIDMIIPEAESMLGKRGGRAPIPGGHAHEKGCGLKRQGLARRARRWRRVADLPIGGRDLLSS